MNLDINKKIVDQLKKLESPKTKNESYMRNLEETCFNFCCFNEKDYKVFLEKLLNHPDFPEKLITDLTYRLSSQDTSEPLFRLTKPIHDETACNFIINTASKPYLKYRFERAIENNGDTYFNQSLLDILIKDYTKTQYGACAYAFTTNEKLIEEKLDTEIPTLPDKRREEICTHIVNNTSLSPEIRYRAFDEFGIIPTKLRNFTPEIQEALFQITVDGYFNSFSLSANTKDDASFLFNLLIDKHLLTPDQEFILLTSIESDRRTRDGIPKTNDYILQKLLQNTKNENILNSSGSDYIYDNPLTSQILIKRKFDEVMQKDVPYKAIGRPQHTLVMQKLGKLYQMLDHTDEKVAKQTTDDLYKYLVKKREDIEYVERYAKSCSHRGYYSRLDPITFARSLYKIIAENPYASEYALNKISKMLEYKYHAHSSRNWKPAIFTAKFNLALREAGFPPERIGELTRIVFPNEIHKDYKPNHFPEIPVTPALTPQEFKKVEEIIHDLMSTTPLFVDQENELESTLETLKEITFNDYMYKQNTDLYDKTEKEHTYQINLEYLLSMSKEEIEKMLNYFSDEELQYFQKRFAVSTENLSKTFLYEHAQDFDKFSFTEKTISKIQKTRKKDEKAFIASMPKFKPPVFVLDENDTVL